MINWITQVTQKYGSRVVACEGTTRVGYIDTTLASTKSFIAFYRVGAFPTLKEAQAAVERVAERERAL